jgi:hypothetical protein
MYNKLMPHSKTSCRTKGSAILRVELEQLYARRSAVEAAIQELELRQLSLNVGSETSLPKQKSEFTSNITL